MLAISPAKKGRGRNRFSFRYTKEEWKGKLYARPKVEAVLRNGDNEFRTLMLIDSGADVSFIPAAVADILKIELSEEKMRSRGVSGWFETRSGECGASMVAKRGILDLRTIPVIVPVVDIDEEEGSSLDYCLLGRDPLFTRYNIHFKQRSRLIIAKRARYD